MSETETPQSAANPIVRSPAYQVVYANNFRFRVSLTDLTIVVARTTELSPGVNGVEELGEVVLPLAQVRPLAQGLNDIIGAWEETFGQVIPRLNIDTKELVYNIRQLKKLSGDEQ